MRTEFESPLKIEDDRAFTIGVAVKEPVGYFVPRAVFHNFRLNIRLLV